MPTDIVKTVGPGRDHADLAAFAAALPADLVAVGERWTAELFDDQADPGGAVFDAVCDADHAIHIRAAAGRGLSDRYDPAVGRLRPDLANGALIATAGGPAVTISGAATRVDIENLQIVSDAGPAIAAGVGAQNQRIRRSVLQGAGTDAVATISGAGAELHAAAIIQTGTGAAVSLNAGAAARSCALVRPNDQPGAAPSAISHDGSAVGLTNSAVVGFLSVDAIGGLSQSAVYHDHAAALDLLPSFGVDGRGMNAATGGWRYLGVEATYTDLAAAPDGAVAAARIDKPDPNIKGYLDVDIANPAIDDFVFRVWVQDVDLGAGQFAYRIRDVTQFIWLTGHTDYDADGAWRQIEIPFSNASAGVTIKLQPFRSRSNGAAGGFRFDMARLDRAADLAALREPSVLAALDLRPETTAGALGAPLSAGDPSETGARDLLNRVRGDAVIGPLALTVGAAEPSAPSDDLAHAASLDAPAATADAGAAPIAAPASAVSAHALDGPAATAHADATASDLAVATRLSTPVALTGLAAAPAPLEAHVRLDAPTGQSAAAPAHPAGLATATALSAPLLTPPPPAGAAATPRRRTLRPRRAR